MILVFGIFLQDVLFEFNYFSIVAKDEGSGFVYMTLPFFKSCKYCALFWCCSADTSLIVFLTTPCTLLLDACLPQQ